MPQEIYPLIFVLLMIGLTAMDPWALAENDIWSGSELHAADRYAIAEHIMNHSFCW